MNCQGMARIPKGEWLVGEDRSNAIPVDREGPTRIVSLNEFFIDVTAVTNDEFGKFVEETGYVTDAERFGWSFVFYAQVHPDAFIARSTDATAPEWWLPVEGAHWRMPDGAGNGFKGREDHPAVHISWRDANAFAQFHGKRLPTEVEWEVAARGGLEGCQYSWGNELHPEGKHMCNIWQGRFPIDNTGEDGWLSTAPALSFPPNGYGLYNMLGNVWEWTSSPWDGSDSDVMAMRGGSYLCHSSYCHRYRVSARTLNHVAATSSHLGFRCARTQGISL